VRLRLMSRAAAGAAGSGVTMPSTGGGAVMRGAGSGAVDPASLLATMLRLLRLPYFPLLHGENSRNHVLRTSLC